MLAACKTARGSLGSSLQEGGRRGALPLVCIRWMGLVTRNWERKRFYKNVSVYRGEDGYGVMLDHRHLRTPLRKKLVLPSEPLALAVAQEWNAQEKLIQPQLMHLTALCNTVLDDPDHRHPDVVITAILQHLLTDTLCFRATEPDDLVALQSKEWDPIISWFNTKFSVCVEATDSLEPPSLPPHTMEPIRRYMANLDAWTLTGFEHCVLSCSSVLLTCALFEGRVGASEACDLARLEVRHQISRWGSVQWQHEVEATDLRSRLAAGLLLKQLLPDKSV